MERETAETAPDTPPPHPTRPTAFNQPIQQEIGQIELERSPQGQLSRPEYPRIVSEHRVREESREADRKQAEDADRWRKLLRLVGTPANASDTPVTLFWDDATMTAMIRVSPAGSGRTHYVDRGSFAAALAEIPEPED